MQNPASAASNRHLIGAIFAASLLFATNVPAAHAQSVAVAPASVPPAGSPPGTAPAPVPSSRPTPDEAGYLIGLGLGQQLHQFGVTDEVSLNRIQKGIHDGLNGKKAQPEDQARLQAMFRAISEAASTKNAAAAKQFLERNAKAKGVVSTASGLQYKVTVAGDAKAASPQLADQVTVQYRGTLLDVPSQGRHQGLAGSAAAHETGRQVGTVHTTGTGLRCGAAAGDPGRLAAEVRRRARERETAATSTAATATARSVAAGCARNAGRVSARCRHALAQLRTCARAMRSDAIVRVPRPGA
jgi:hypothetical protein